MFELSTLKRWLYCRHCAEVVRHKSNGEGLHECQRCGTARTLPVMARFVAFA